METQRKLSDDSDYVQILDGQELRKKAIGLYSKQGAADQIRDLLSQSIAKFKPLVEDPNFKSKPEYNSAVFEYANTLVTKAEIERELKAIEGVKVDTWNIVEQASSLLKQLSTDSTNADILRLQGQILFEKAKREQDLNELKESEQTLMFSCEKLLEAFQKQSDDQNTTRLLENVLDLLTNGKKERKKQGKAVYQCACEFMKQGTMLKSSYKQYFVVVEESTINLFKTKKDWESGPVVGVRKVAPHSVTFSEVQSISACKMDGQLECTAIKSPKYKDNHCLHIIRPEKPIHLFFPLEGSTQEFEEFLTSLKFAYRMYRVKREVKNVLSGGQTSLDDLIKDKGGSQGSSSGGSNNNNSTTSPLSPRGIIKAKGKQTNKLKRRVSWSEKAQAVVSEDEPNSEEDSKANSEEESDDDSDIDDDDDDDDNPFFAVSIDSPLKHEEEEEKDRVPVVEIQWKDFTPHQPIIAGIYLHSHSASRLVNSGIQSNSSNESNTNQVKRELHNEQEDPQEMNFKQFETYLGKLSNEEVQQILFKLFTQYEEEGQLRKLLQQVVTKNPKDYLLKISNLEDFNIARYGAFQRTKNLMTKKNVNK